MRSSTPPGWEKPEPFSSASPTRKEQVVLNHQCQTQSLTHKTSWAFEERSLWPAISLQLRDTKKQAYSSARGLQTEKPHTHQNRSPLSPSAQPAHVYPRAMQYWLPLPLKTFLQVQANTSRYTPRTKTAFSTAKTAPSTIRFWEAASKWRSQEERIPTVGLSAKRTIRKGNTHQERKAQTSELPVLCASQYHRIKLRESWG